MLRDLVSAVVRFVAAIRRWASGPYESTIAVVVGLTWMLSPPLFWAAAVYGLVAGDGDNEDVVALFVAGAVVGAIGAIVTRLCRAEPHLTVRQALTALVAGVLSAIAAVMVAHLASGAVSVGDLDIALAESVAAVTATNVSALELSQLSEAMVGFRAFTQWISGAGFIIILVGVMSHLGVGGLDADGGVATRSARRLADRQAENIARLLLLYGLVSLAIGVAYIAAGMDFFDAVLHSATTISTGGFSPHEASIGFYDSASIEWVAIVGMIIGGTNLPLLFLAIRRADPLRLFRSYEFGVYLGLIALCSIWLMAFGPEAGGERLGTAAVRHAIFSASSAASTTGFSVGDFSALAGASGVALVAVMLVGGMSASLAGGFKAVRMLALLSYVRRELRRVAIPRLWSAIHLRSSTISDSSVNRIAGELLSASLLAVPCVVLLAGGGLDLEGAWSLVVSLMSNVGPALGEAGPSGHLSALGVVGRITASVLMLMGRVSVTAVLVAFSVAAYPSYSYLRYRYVVSRRTEPVA